VRISILNLLVEKKAFFVHGVGGGGEGGGGGGGGGGGVVGVGGFLFVLR